jgi:hypothetical protein
VLFTTLIYGESIKYRNVGHRKLTFFLQG